MSQRFVSSLLRTFLLINCLMLFNGRVAGQTPLLTVQVGSPPPPPTPLINHGDSWRYHKGTNAPQANWMTLPDGSLDATWGTGNGGFGYADNTPETQLCQTILSDMRSNYSTFYMRKAITVVSGADTNTHLTLRMDFDDGFIAWLDGNFLTNRLVTGAPAEPAFTAVASASHESSNGDTATRQQAETYDFGAVGSRLSPGTHVLAIIGLNQNKNTSTDFIQIADLQLTGGSSSAPASGAFGALVQTNSVDLSGSNTVVGSTRVTVNGDDAAFSQGAWSRTQSLKPGVNRLYIAALDNAGHVLSNITQDVIYETTALTASGTLSSSLLASNSGTVLYVMSSVIVPNNLTFEVANGAVVLVSPSQSIIAQNGGRIYVHGTFDQRVFFNVNGISTALWGPLNATGTNSVIDVQFADIARSQASATSGASGLLQDSDLHDFDPGGAAGILNRPIVNCNFASLFEARRLHVWNYYECLVRNGIIHVEHCLLERMSGDALDFDSGQPGSYTLRNTYRHGDLGNVDAVDIGPSGDLPGSTDTLIANSIMWDFPFDKGVSVGDGGSSHGIIVSNCLIYNCFSGVMSKDLCDVSVRNCTLVQNNWGFTNYNKANPGSATGGGITTNSYNNILWGNITTIGLANNSQLYADHNDLGNTNWPGDGNINADPLFVDPAVRNYRLQSGSPCLGTGRDGVDMGITYPLGGIPAQPLQLAVLSSGTNALVLTWIDDSQNEDGVLVQRSTDAMNWTAIATLAPDTTNHTDGTAVLGQKYYYRVQHTNYVGMSLFSNIGSGTRQAPSVSVGGTISANTTWVSGTHYIVTSTVTIASGATLTIQPGALVCFNTGIGMIIASAGRLLAEGTAQAPILFTRSPANNTTWDGVTINGTVGSPETRIAYVNFQFSASSPCIDVAAGTVYLDHLTFGNTAASYIHVDGASFIIQNCVFPSATASFEMLHGTGGIKSGGHGIMSGNFFGVPIGYSDVVDFTGGNRPGPIIQFLNNVFIGATDDILDLDGTDAWIEGNIFLHAHKNGSPDTASAVSGSDDSGNTSEITIIGNIIYDCDHAVMGKGGNFYTLINNTIVHQSHAGGTDSDGAVLCLADAGFGEAAGMYVEGSIIYDAEKLLRFHTNSIVTFTNNQMQLPWSGPGGNNSTNNPLLKHIPLLTETSNFTSWAQAQIMWDWFSLQTNSPALGTGPNGRDKGGVIPYGVSISGEPGTTTQTNAVLTVGLKRTGNGIPVAGWPNGSGFTHYKWRLDTNLLWSAETPITTPISLTSLADGAHHVEVIGKNDAGYYQDDPAFGTNAVVSLSDTWHVQSSLKITSANLSGADFTLHFVAAAGNTYTIEYRDALDAAHPWTKLKSVPAQVVSGDYLVTDSPAAGQSRFYRVVTP